MTIICAMWYDAMALAHKLFALFSFLLKSLFFFFDMATMQNAQTKIAILYMREQSCDTRDDMIPRRYEYYMVCMQWKVWITNVHK